MTRRLVLSTMMVLVFAVSAFSQKGGEVFGGYSYQRSTGLGMNGFTGSVTGNMNSWFGITGEISHHSYGTSMLDPFSGFTANADTGILAYRVGPKFTKRMNDTASVFVHTLIGGYRASVNVETTAPDLPTVTVNASGSGFTAAMGGGFDLRVAPRIAIRPVQMDWIHLRSASIAGEDLGNSNAFRYTGGIVFRF